MTTTKMDETTAHRTVARIRDCFASAGRLIDEVRRLLLELHEKEGWVALGYDSWRECAAQEFGRSQGQLYRQLDAARIERDIGSFALRENSTLPCRSLAPLAPLAPDSRRAVGQELFAHGNRPSVAQINAAVLSRMSEDQQRAFVEAADARSRAASERTDRGAEMARLEKVSEGWPGVIRHLEAALAGAVRMNNHVNRVRLALRNVKRWQRLACEEIADTLAACEGRRAA